MFKLFRIFKLNDFIITSSITKSQKTLMVICKLFGYYILWCHSVGCGAWIVLGWNADAVYYKKAEGVKGYDYCVYANFGQVYKITGTDNPLPCDD